MNRIFIRLFAEVPSTSAAATLAERLRGILLTVFPAVAIVTVRQYWKVEAYQEVCLRAEGSPEPMEAFSKVLQLFGEGWVLGSIKGEAIWNIKENSAFDPAVRWAHVEVMDSQSGPDPG